MQQERRVVITGLGAVSPLGNTARESWEAALRGVCGIALSDSLGFGGHNACVAIRKYNE